MENKGSQCTAHLFPLHMRRFRLAKLMASEMTTSNVKDCPILNLPRVQRLKYVRTTNGFGQEEPWTSHLGEWQNTFYSKILEPKIYFSAEWCFYRAYWPYSGPLPCGTFCGRPKNLKIQF